MTATLIRLEQLDAINHSLWLPGHGLNGTVAAGSQAYTPLFYSGISTGAAYNFSVPRACVLRRFRAVTNSAQPATGTLVANVYINNVSNGTKQLTWAAGEGSAAKNEDTEVSLSAGDALTVRWTNNASGASAQINAVVLEVLEPITPAGDGSGSYVTDAGYVSFSPSGSIAAETVQAALQELDGDIQAGTYLPQATNGTNVASSTVNSDFFYIRIKNMVIVSGSVIIDPTAAGNTELGLSLPVASNFANSYNANGNGTSPGINPLSIVADSTNDRVTCVWTSPGTSQYFFRLLFMYVVL